MPLHDRLYLTQYLFDHPASEWIAYWEENNKGKGWDDFLFAVLYHFASELTEKQLGGNQFAPESDEEVSQVIIDSQFGTRTQLLNVASTDIIANESSYKSIISNVSLNMNLESNKIFANGIEFDMDVINEVDPFHCIGTPKSYTGRTVDADLQLPNCEMGDGNLQPEVWNIRGVSGDAAILLALYGDARTIPPCDTFPTFECSDADDDDHVEAIIVAHKGHTLGSSIPESTTTFGNIEEVVFDGNLETHNTVKDYTTAKHRVGVLDDHLAHIEVMKESFHGQAINGDNYGYAPAHRSLVLAMKLAANTTIALQLLSYCGDVDWNIAPLQFDADNGVHIFDPGDFRADDNRAGEYSGRRSKRQQFQENCQKDNIQIYGGSVTPISIWPVGTMISTFLSRWRGTIGSPSYVRMSSFKLGKSAQLEGSLVTGRPSSSASVPVPEMQGAWSSFAFYGLEEVDPEIRNIVHKEKYSQFTSLELVASRNFHSHAAMAFCVHMKSHSLRVIKVSIVVGSIGICIDVSMGVFAILDSDLRASRILSEGELIGASSCSTQGPTRQLRRLHAAQQIEHIHSLMPSPRSHSLKPVASRPMFSRTSAQTMQRLHKPSPPMKPNPRLQISRISLIIYVMLF